ncbi:sugar nucleotide-binding protein [Shewanella frigidimarina]|uniref:sugar nucleotide-binding protein n=1 Tax=Shewanella frigidimarina TaxID=56812 RepID=UPI00128F78E8
MLIDNLARFCGNCVRKKWSAIYHWSNAGKCTWYEFAQEIKTQGIALGLLPRVNLFTAYYIRTICFYR